MTDAYHFQKLVGRMTLSGAVGVTLLNGAVAAAVPYPEPPGYFSSYDQGYATMTPLVGSKYFFSRSSNAADPASQLGPACKEEYRLARNRPPDADAFAAGCMDAARHAMGIDYPCDRWGDDPVCPRRP